MSVAVEKMAQSQPDKPLLDPEEEAAYLGISRSTLDRWSKTPGFPVLRSGHVVKFPWKTVDEFLERASREGIVLYSRSSTPRKRRK